MSLDVRLQLTTAHHSITPLSWQLYLKSTYIRIIMFGFVYKIHGDK